MKFSSFDEACSYIESFTNLAKSMNYTVRTYRLDRMRALLDHFGHPEEDFKIIHVAGSKGKGSTALYIAKGLSSLGYRTGLYASPHVSTYRERFTLSGLFFDDHFLLSTVREMINRLDTFTFKEEYGYTSPTTFELLTLLGFLLFSKSDCSYAVIETGLGGRLDATNVVLPIMSVITPIELEHTAVLGDTIAKIAYEKAGIIKPGVPVCVSYQEEAAEEVIRARAVELSSPISFLTDVVDHIDSTTTKTGEQTAIYWKQGDPYHCMLSMPGSFQAENAALAIHVLQSLDLFRLETSLSAVARATIPGRMELIRENPSIYIDGAHTEHSIERLFCSFRSVYPTGGVLIFGAVEGKNHHKMAELALDHFQTIVISTPGTFKRSHPKELYQLFLSIRESEGFRERHGDSSLPAIYLIPDPTLALDAAVKLTGEHNGVILTAGSFYMAAEIRNVVCS